MNTIDFGKKEKGLSLCAEFLGGTWAKISMDDFQIEPISGGLSNILYQCSLSDKTQSEEGELRKVLLRLYGQIIQENPETVVTDSVIFGLLAEKNMGPRLYGVFTEGRVEEYIQSRHLRTKELHDPDISEACARIMAQFHKLTMPLCKKPRWLFNSIERYLDGALSSVTFDYEDASDREKLQKMFSYDLAKEVDNLKAIVAQVDSPVTFCHNDLQEGNILYVEDNDQIEDRHVWEVRPIDFEYSSYNYRHLLSFVDVGYKEHSLLVVDHETATYDYRGFDIGNHFCEWCYDYSVKETPYYSACLENYPNREQQITFVRAYLEGDHCNMTPVKEEDIEHVLLEADAFALASHMLWGLWSIVQSQMSTINFKYLDYALVRIQHYMIQKSRLPVKILRHFDDV